MNLTRLLRCSKCNRVLAEIILTKLSLDGAAAFDLKLKCWKCRTENIVEVAANENVREQKIPLIMKKSVCVAAKAE